VSEKNVSQALETLVSRGYVLKISPTKISKKGKKRKGRQPSYLYKLKSIQEIIKSVKRDLVEKQRAILGVLDQMSEIEEAAAASREEEYSIEV
jgi:predicted transcriptional regulator